MSSSAGPPRRTGSLHTSLQLAHQYVGPESAAPPPTSFGRSALGHIGCTAELHVGQSPPREAPTTTAGFRPRSSSDP